MVLALPAPWFLLLLIQRGRPLLASLRTALPLEADCAVDDVLLRVALAVAAAVAARPPLPLLLAGALRCQRLRPMVRGTRLPRCGRLREAGVDAMGLWWWIRFVCSQ